MFGAPPVGHVMDPQFKPVFFGLWRCKCKYVVSTQVVAWQKETSRICISMAGFRGIYQIFRHIFSIIQYSPLKILKMHSNCEHHMISCISMEDFRGIYQIFRHIFSIIQYSPLKILKMHSNCEHHMISCISMEDFRGIYQIFRHIFSIIQYSPLKRIQIANRWTYSHWQNYGKKQIMETIIMEKKRFVTFLS